MIEQRGMANSSFENIVSEIRQFAETAKDLTSLQEFCVSIISERLPHYSLVGFYMLDPSDENVLGPFRGAPTEHIRIPVMKGIYGAAAARGETVIVEDVSADPRCLACSLETRSEIVVPVQADGKIVGEIDIDSHALNAFGASGRSILDNCAGVLGQFLENKDAVSPRTNADSPAVFEIG
jgi:L-methionine (R)-S-oxide reductase